MLTPADKVLHGGNDIMQLVITRVCDLNCSNCTQLLPFRTDIKHMSLDVFRAAVQSVKDWPGVVALFGGNPCAHPKFDDICTILSHEIPDQRRRGLWTNNLFNDRKGEVARNTFYPSGRFNLNSHDNSSATALFDKWLPGRMIQSTRTKASWHAPILMDYRDYGMSEEDWISARENCDINQRWSGAIAERNGKAYGYFCEVASSLDGIRGMNHGIEVHPGWWKLPMSYFHEQVRKCCDAGCAVPLRRKGSLDNAETYDISPAWLASVSGKSTTIKLHESLPDATEIPTDYQAQRSRK